MMFIKLQLFAHKKGTSSTKTDATAQVNVSELNAPTVNLQKRVTSLSDSAELTFTPVTT